MFEHLKSIFKKSNDQLFSSMAILPFGKYKKNWSNTDFLQAYEISLYTNRALNKRAEKVGEIEFELHRGDQLVENHQILDLLSKPSPSFTGAEFWGLYQKYYDIFGEVYLLADTEARLGGTSRINNLYPLRSDMVKPFFSKETGELTKIEYRTAEGTTTYTGDQIIYSHNPDPQNPLRGESLLRSGIRQIETSTQIDEYHSKVLENGGRVEGVFNFKAENLNRQQLREIKDSYQEEYGNASKAGLPMFLSGNATYDRLGLSPAELAYLETKKATLQDIVYLTGVPEAVLGMTSGETFANSDAAIRVFLRETIKPLLNALTTKLNEKLVPDEFELVFIDPTPEDKEEKRKDLETADRVHALTINEKRESLGLDPIDNGDDILVPFNLTPLNKPEAPTPEPEEKEPEEKSIKKSAHPLDNVETRKIYHALQLKRLDHRTDEMLKVMREYFKGQEERVIEALQGRKHFRKKNIISEVFVTGVEIKLAKDTALPVLRRLLKEAGEDSKEIAGSDWEFNETAEVGAWLDKRGDVFAKQINETTFNQLQSTFTESLAAGETREQLVGRIQDTYGNITAERARVIARTEVHSATMKGTLEGYLQAGLPDKVWVHAPGVMGGIRDEHIMMDGTRIPARDDFVLPDGSTTPAPGLTGTAHNDINCMCFI